MAAPITVTSLDGKLKVCPSLSILRLPFPLSPVGLHHINGRQVGVPVIYLANARCWTGARSRSSASASTR